MKIETLTHIRSQLAHVKKQVHYYKNALEACQHLNVPNHIKFYRTTLIKLLQLQCDLTEQEVLLELTHTPNIIQALDIIGVDYTPLNGQIYINP